MGTCSTPTRKKCGRVISSVLFTLLRVTLTLLAVLFSPILFLGYGCLLGYRGVVSVVARYADPRLGKMVSALSAWFAAHDTYGNSYTINIALHVDGKIDRPLCLETFESFKEQYGAQYPELWQNIVTKFGYKFWRKIDHFQVDPHIAYLNPEDPDKVVTLQEIQDTIAKFGKTPMNPSRSPWQVYVVKNFTSETNGAAKSAVIVRLHHAMFDGYSVLSVMSKLVDNGPLVLAGQEKWGAQLNRLIPNYRSWQGWLQAVVLPILIFFRGPYELFGQMMSYDDNELTRQSKEGFKGVMRRYECPPIPLEDLREIKTSYGVSMTALTTTLVVLGLKRFMEERKVTPKKVHMTFPLPVVNHPDKLRNYFSGGIISFDLTQDDPLKLLLAVEQKYHRFRFAFVLGLPQVSMLLLRMIGSLPIFLVPRIDNVALGTTLMHSSLPGPVDIATFQGFPIVDATVGGSISRPYPTSTLCYSYNGLYKFAVIADASIFPSPGDAEEMGTAIYNAYLHFSQKIKQHLV